MYRPKSAEVFAAKIQRIEEEKKKATHLLFDAIESDVQDKEEFVQKMSKQILEMQSDVNKMDDYMKVLQFVREMLP